MAMLFLLLTISCSVTMAMLLKLADKAGSDSTVVIASNYVAGSIVGWLLIAFDGGTSVSVSTVGFGLIGGLIWPLPFFILTRTIRALGVAIAAPLARFGLIIPVLFGLLFLGEGLTLAGAVGLVIALLAILLLSPLDFKRFEAVDRQGLWLIPVMIVMIGIASLWVNLFNEAGISAETNLFFTLVYNFAAAFTLIVLWFRKIPVKREAVMRGALIGLPNFFYTFFLLQTLRAPIFAAHSAIVYTIVNVAYMLLVFSAGMLIWREPVTRKNMAGVGVACIALLLLNLR